MARKFLSSSIQELETLFGEQNGNLELLQTLYEELRHRKTKRAARLRSQVLERLTALKPRASLPEHISQESSPVTPYKHQPASPFNEKQISRTPHLLDVKASVGSETLHAETRTAPPLTLLPITNQPEEVLSAWIALEVLSPPAYVRPEDLAGGDRTRVATLSESVLPWERGEKSRPNQRLYYQVILGSVKLEPVVAHLIERYGDNRLENSETRGKAALAVVMVDRQGRLVESPAIGVSSFGWGVISALNGELANLVQWSEFEPQLVERIEKSLLGVTTRDKDTEEHRNRPITREALLIAYQTLIHELGLPQEWIEPPEFAIRSYSYFKDPNPPEPILLNSFFLKDLVLAQQLFSEGKATQNLRRYLGVERPHSSQDLLRNTTALAEAVSPKFTQLARWPGQGRHPLVLLQQAAVNLAFRETKAGGLLGINGPPGTGKTTLLRDLVAGVVAERAEKMAKFDDPEIAFKHSGQKIKSGNSWIHLYQVSPALRGFEMIVASSNNKAVENVSSELPEIDAISNDIPELRYFKTLSDTLHQSDTWGVIAAVLGNSKNRSRFKQSFWWDDDSGLNSYLWATVGSVKEVEVTDSEGRYVERRLPRIVEVEQPPSNHEEALERWRSARQKFLSALDKSRQCQEWLESLNAELKRLQSLAQAENNTAIKYNAAVEITHRLEVVSTTARQAMSEALCEVEKTNQELYIHNLTKPKCWARFFRRHVAREWSDKFALLTINHQNAETQHTNTTVECRRIENELQRARVEQQNAETAWTKACAEYQHAKQQLADAQQKYGVVLTDDAFFALDYDKQHQMTPWFSSAAQRLRDDVFISAMALHRTFIDAAAKPLRHNIGALMNVFMTQTLDGVEKQTLLPDLWSSLFIVVPLLSTTFASVNRMLGKLPPESLGWLFVDEAGQALPQAAVGALLRTRRAVIVGDPIQIEPVVMLPDTLTNAICRRFGVAPDQYAAPLASVQTLADAASTYTSEFQHKIGSRSVGVPLLVHRRCSEPMFSISNAIAYSNMMVFAKLNRPSVLRDLLGSSRWIHVESTGEDKWCPAEGNEVLRLLYQMARAHVKPDIYIITPFVLVADRLRQIVRESEVLKNWIDQDDWRWSSERIGTVHTVQGREAEVVILVLGAPHPAQTGARNWAGGRPNLLNVAVTRAKEAIYVIGNRQLWREAGLFYELDKRLP